MEAMRKMFSTKRQVREKMDEMLLTGFKKLFPRLVTKRMTDPARSALMAAISNLGTYAFGAYKNSEAEGLREETTEKNIIQHMRPDFVYACMEGAIKIQLKKAQDLKDSDGIGRGHSDPYVVISLGGSCVTSEIKENTANPVWDSTHYLFVRKLKLEPETDKQLRIAVFDHDTRKGIGSVVNVIDKDDFLGSATIDIESIAKTGEQEFTLSLDDVRKGKKTASTITLSIEQLSVKEALNQLDLQDNSDKWMEAVATDPTEDDKMVWSNLTLMTDLGFVKATPVAFIDAQTSGTQAWVHISLEAKVVIVAFRGTEMTSFKDILTDGTFFLSPMTATSLSTSYAMKPTETMLNEGIKLHRGFRDAYGNVRETILRIIYDLTSWNEDWTVCMTGHSLGGALATLCAFEVANRKIPVTETAWQSMMSSIGVIQKPTGFAGPKVGVMSFGAPKVGEKDFANAFNATVSESLRVVTSTDLVHFLPPFRFYKHVQYQVDVKPDGEVVLHGTTLQEVDRDTDVEVDGSLTEDDKEGAKITDRAFNRINVQSHLQPYYFQVVNEAVTKFFKNDLELRGRPLRILRAMEITGKARGYEHADD